MQFWNINAATHGKENFSFFLLSFYRIEFRNYASSSIKGGSRKYFSHKNIRLPFSSLFLNCNSTFCAKNQIVDDKYSLFNWRHAHNEQTPNGNYKWTHLTCILYCIYINFYWVCGTKSNSNWNEVLSSFESVFIQNFAVTIKTNIENLPFFSTSRVI